MVEWGTVNALVGGSTPPSGARLTKEDEMALTPIGQALGTLKRIADSLDKLVEFLTKEDDK